MTIWLGKDPLILASRSRARQTLLSNAGVLFEAVPADIDEREIQRASSLVAKPQPSASSVFIEWKKLSTTALSQQLPRLLMLATMPRLESRARYVPAVY